MKSSVAILVIALSVAAPISLWAQPSVDTPSPAFYASSGVSLARQTYGRRDCPYLCGPIGGSGLGALFALGESVSPRLAVSAEVNVANKVSGQQSLRTSIFGNFEAVTDHRDVMFTGVARWSTAQPKGAVSIALVVGGGIARRVTQREGAIYESVIGGTRITPREDTLRDYVPTLVGGVDLPARFNSRVALVPFFRLYWLMDTDGGKNPPKRGVGSKSIQSGATIEVRF